jgi:hypothetical protein
LVRARHTVPRRSFLGRGGFGLGFFDHFFDVGR